MGGVTIGHVLRGEAIRTLEQFFNSGIEVVNVARSIQSLATRAKYVRGLSRG